jgi:hypothetical protein
VARAVAAVVEHLRLLQLTEELHERVLAVLLVHQLAQAVAVVAALPTESPLEAA